VVDESWALSRRPDGSFDRRVLVVVGGLLYASWIASTALGALSNVTIPDPSRLGLDAAFPALFLALLVPQLKLPRSLSAALVGGGLGLLLVPFLPVGLPLLAAVAACLLGLLRPRPA
jgi:predicted branched-subunit amino acid permease